MVAITTTGSATAGEMLTLTCRVTVVEGLTVQPDVEWADPGDGAVMSDVNDVTVGSVMRSGSESTLVLEFSPLRTSHGGQYTCRATINVPLIDISDLSNSSSQDVTVQSKSTHLIIIILLYEHINFMYGVCTIHSCSNACTYIITCTSVHRCIMYTHTRIEVYTHIMVSYRIFCLRAENISAWYTCNNLDIHMLNKLTLWVFGATPGFFGKTAVPIVLGSEIESGGLSHLYQHLCPKRISSIISLHDVPGSLEQEKPVREHVRNYYKN